MRHISPHSESAMTYTLIAAPLVYLLIWLFNSYKLGKIRKKAYVALSVCVCAAAVVIFALIAMF